MASKRKNRRAVYRLYNKETGENYIVRLSREAYDKLADKALKKFSKKERKHVDFKITKLKKGN